MSRSLGVGLIGLGWMGRLHSIAFSRVRHHYPDLPLRPRLVIAGDALAEREAVATGTLGYEQFTTDWQQVVDHPDVDVVSITAPNHLHREMAESAAAAGKHIWVEKPAGRDLADTTAIAEAVERAGVFTAIGYNYRYAPAIQHIRHLLTTGALGTPTHVRGTFLNDYAAEPNGALSWRFRRDQAGSGVLGDLLTHTVDLLQYLLGPMTAVTAQTETFIRDRPVVDSGAGTHFAVVEGGPRAPVENEDYVGALARFGAGACGTLEASRVTVGPRCRLAIDLHGTQGAASWDFERMNEVQVCHGPGLDYTTVRTAPGHGDYAAFQPGPAIAMGYDDLKVIEAAGLLRSIAQGRQHGAGIRDGLATARVLAAMSTSAGSGRWERI